MSVVQGESRMAWPILQEDNYSRGQAAVNWEKTGAVDVISAGKQAGLAAAPCRSLPYEGHLYSAWRLWSCRPGAQAKIGGSAVRIRSRRYGVSAKSGCK